MVKIALNAHLLSDQPGYRSAGISTVIHQLLLNLPKHAPDDWHFTALLGANNSLTYDQIAIKRSRGNTNSPFNRVIWEQVFQPGLLKEFDLYHAMAFVAPFRNKTPTVVTVYDLGFLRYPERLTTARRIYLQNFTKLTCRSARRIIAISQSTAQDLVDFFHVQPEKIDVTPLGYDPQLFREYAEEEVAGFRHQKSLPERFWFFLGTLEPRKNLPTLLKAYARLHPDDRLPLYLAGGKGWQYDEIFQTIEQFSLEEDVILTGYLPLEEIPLWYNCAETVVYPSVFEGFGLPVLEAMACGTPVVVSDSSSLPEVVGDAGVLVPPHDIEAWATALQHAEQDQNWRENMRKDGLERVKQFSWERTAEMTVESYRKTLQI